MKKTNAMRILDSLSIQYKVKSYEDNAEHPLELGAAQRTAQKIGADPEAVFKTIVMRADTNEIIVFCQSAPYSINVKKARTVAGVKSLESLKPEKLQPLTGYVRGGCSPIGMKKLYRTFIDESALYYDTIFISAGQRGLQLELNPQDIAQCINAQFCDLILE